MYIDIFNTEDLLEDELVDLDWNYYQKKENSIKFDVNLKENEIDESDE